MIRPAIIATAFAFFGYAYILHFFLSWFPSYLTMAQHLSIQKMSIVSVIPWAVGMTGLIAGSFVCDLLVKKTGRAIYSCKIVLIVSLSAGAICIGVTGAVTDLTSTVALMAIAVFFMYASFNTYFAIVLDTMEKRRVGEVGGFVHFIANLVSGGHRRAGAHGLSRAMVRQRQERVRVDRRDRHAPLRDHRGTAHHGEEAHAAHVLRIRGCWFVDRIDLSREQRRFRASAIPAARGGRFQPAQSGDDDDRRTRVDAGHARADG